MGGTLLWAYAVNVNRIFDLVLSPDESILVFPSGNGNLLTINLSTVTLTTYALGGLDGY